MNDTNKISELFMNNDYREINHRPSFIDIDKCFNKDNTRKPADTKTILIWNKFDYKYHLGLTNDNKTESCMQCGHHKCYITKDRNMLKTSDGILFSLENIAMHNLPKFRRSTQRWIVLYREAPIQSYMEWIQIDGLFNWTMTYHTKHTDIWVPYGYKIKRTTPRTEKEVQSMYKILPSEPKVLWVARNCRAKDRNRVIRELSETDLKVDILGTCANSEDPCILYAGSDPSCPNYGLDFILQYKFYLAFENCHCEDYLTEKVNCTIHYKIFVLF